MTEIYQNVSVKRKNIYMGTQLRWRFISIKALHEAIETEAYLEMLYTVDDIKKLLRKKIKKPFHVGDSQVSFNGKGERFYSFYISKNVKHVQVSMRDDGCIYFYFYKKLYNHSALTLCVDEPFRACDENTLYHALELSAHFLNTGDPCLS